MLWDGEAEAEKCIACARYSYLLIDGATLPRPRPPKGHVGIDLQRRRPIPTRGEPEL